MKIKMKPGTPFFYQTKKDEDLLYVLFVKVQSPSGITELCTRIFLNYSLIRTIFYKKLGSSSASKSFLTHIVPRYYIIVRVSKQVPILVPTITFCEKCYEHWKIWTSNLFPCFRFWLIKNLGPWPKFWNSVSKNFWVVWMKSPSQTENFGIY